MKKLTAILCASALATGAFAQGTISVLNGTYSLARTNSTGLSGGTAGNAAGTLGGFYYAVFTAASTTTSIDANLQNLLSGAWTFTGVYATNIAAAGRLSGGSGVATTQGWTPGVTNSYLLLGWSSAVGSLDVSNVLGQLRNATFSGGVWGGTNFSANATGGAGFLGVSAIGFGESGGGTTGLPPFGLFGTTATSAGTPIGSPFDMFAIANVPEPGTFALAGLGAAALLIFRRRK